jgi:hypothetical protein
MTALQLALAASFAGCAPEEPNVLESMSQADISIGEHTFRAWVADDPDRRERGLMKITAEEMQPLPDGTERGMIFVFPTEQRHGFWMKDTIIPLDIAFIRTDGTIVTIHTMAPLDTRQYYPEGSYRYALEVRGNTFSGLKVRSGARVEIPESLLKDAR